MPRIEPIASTSGLKKIGRQGAKAKSDSDDEGQSEGAAAPQEAPSSSLGEGEVVDEEDESESSESDEEEAVDDEGGAAEVDGDGGGVEAGAREDIAPDPTSDQARAEADEARAEDSEENDEEEDDDDDSSSDEDDDESDSDSDEPTLKYARLGGETDQILAKDTASAMAVSSKYIVSNLTSPLFYELSMLTLSGFRLSARTTERSSCSTLPARLSTGTAPTAP